MYNHDMQHAFDKTCLRLDEGFLYITQKDLKA